MSTSKEMGDKVVFGSILILAHVVLLLASYRTYWFGVVAYWVVFFILITPRISLEKRIFLYISSAAIITLVSVLAGQQILGRLDPLFELLSQPSEYVRLDSIPADSFVAVQPILDRNMLLSGRVDLWNAAIGEYLNASVAEKILGLGIHSVNEITQRLLGNGYYAHNEYVSSLVETGILGFLALLSWIIVISYRIFERLKQGHWCTIVSAPIFPAIMMAAVAAMPFHGISALLCLGVYTGVSLYCVSGRADIHGK